MLNLSQLARQSKDIPLGLKLRDLFTPETYIARNVADYRSEREILIPPRFKRTEFLPAGHYAFVLFYNVGIDAIVVNGDLERTAAQIHDASGQFVTLWTGPGNIFPTSKEYAQFLEDGDLKPKDFVYRMCVRHSYLGKTSYVVSIEKDKFTTRKTKEATLVDRLGSLFPEFEPA